MAEGARGREPAGRGGDRLRPGLELAEVAGGDDDAALERRQPQAADQELARDDRGDHPGREDALVEQHDRASPSTSTLSATGSSSEPNDERAARAARDPAVEPVGRHRDAEDRRSPSSRARRSGARRAATTSGAQAIRTSRQLVGDRHRTRRIRPAASRGSARATTVGAVDLYEHQGKELLAPLRDPGLAGPARRRRRRRRGARPTELGGPVVAQGPGADAAGAARPAGSGCADRPRRGGGARPPRSSGSTIGGAAGRAALASSRPATIAREYYLSVSARPRRAARRCSCSRPQGGVEIEQVAAEQPEALARVHVDPLEGFEPHHARELLAALADRGRARRRSRAIVGARSTAASSSRDATLCEINPLDRHARRARCARSTRR